MRRFAFLFAFAALAPTPGLCETSAAPEDAQLSCLLEPSGHVMVASAVQGLVRRVTFERGDAVTTGQPLIELESEVERARLAEASEKAAFLSRRLDRNKEMMDKDLLSGDEGDQIRTDAAVAQLEAKTARADLDRRTARSPVAGVVLDRKVSEGEYVTTDPFAELVALDPLYAEIVMRAESYGAIKVGERATVNLGAPVNAAREGKVVVVDPAIDPASATFRVRISLSNPGMKIPSGLKCTVERFGAVATN